MNRIPTAAELLVWKARYKAGYKARHRAQNDAARRLATEELTSNSPGMVRADGNCFTGNVAEVAAHVEAEIEAVESLVSQGSDEFTAVARGYGFGARRDGLPATDNPYDEGRDPESFMAWYAGWVQADPNVVVPRSAGYIPPTGYRCVECDRPENTLHRRACSYRGIYTEDALRVTRGQCGEMVKDTFHVENPT